MGAGAEPPPHFNHWQLEIPQKISTSHVPTFNSLKVIGTHTDRSATYEATTSC